MGMRSEVIDMLAAKKVDDATRQLVVAAWLGPDMVDKVLSGEQADPVTDPAETDKGQVPSVYLESLTVNGFRGIGPEATLQLNPQPGLTVVAGRNGSGKSSFFDALEVLLTDDSYRWKGKPKVWQGGWRNLHQATGPRVMARFQVEGVAGDTVVEKTWDDGAKDVGDASTTAQHHGQKRSDLIGLGWTEPLELYRPLLSHPELGTIASKPSGLYDTLSKVLGLEDMASSIQVLSKARSEREGLNRDVSARLGRELLPALKAIDDDRAAVALGVLSKIPWELDIIDRLLTGGDTPSTQPLRVLARLTLPTLEQVMTVAEQVEMAVLAVEDLAGTDMQRFSNIADLLENALNHHRLHGDEFCPVCGEGRLDDQWQSSARSRIKELRKEASRYRAAEHKLKEELHNAQLLASPRPLPEGTLVDISELRESWERWNALPKSPSKVPQHLIDHCEVVTKAAQSVVRQAQEWHSEREALWAPVRDLLLAWIPDARRAEKGRHDSKLIKDAETALKEISEELRSSRWEPIEKEALGLWRNLRLQSTIDLESIGLTGTGTRRRVDLKVKVNGKEVAALGVASQGEINCLALSLFFPRGTLPESPFRFLVIDDPVQAMDPARVDGLARVFHHIATERQLVVFTHDDRLPEALRRLRLPCSITEVTRLPGSVVTVRNALDPVEQYFEDARALASDRRLPSDVAIQSVPGICRQGLEAACMERIRRRRIGRGQTHAQVEEHIAKASTLKPLAALALLEDLSKTSQVVTLISQRWGPDLADVFQVCNRRVHEGYSGNLTDFINQCTRLAKRIKGD